MSVLNFIKRNEDGVLELKRNDWAIFRNDLLSLARNAREMEFVGRLVEDLQAEYEERLEELERFDHIEEG